MMCLGLNKCLNKDNLEVDLWGELRLHENRFGGSILHLKLGWKPLKQDPALSLCV